MARQSSERRRNTRDHRSNPVPNDRKRPLRRDDQNYQTYNQSKRRREPDTRFKNDDLYERRRRTRSNDHRYSDRYQERTLNSRRNSYDYQQENYRLEQSYVGKNDHSKKQKTPGQLIFSFVWTIVFYTMTIGVICSALMFAFGSKTDASIFGYRFYTVLSDSMAPQKDGPSGGFYTGDMLLVKMMDGSKVKKGDIVTLAVGDGSRYLTHRVVERKSELNGEKGDFLVTKGDANENNDPPIEANRVLGKVLFSIPKVGNVMDFIRAEFWACLVAVLSLYGFFLVLKSYFFTADDQEKVAYQISKRTKRVR